MMTNDAIPMVLRERYPEAWIRGARITRSEERTIGHFRLDLQSAWELGTDNIGVFIGDCPDLANIVERLQRLERRALTPRWVVIVASKKMAVLVIQQWFRSTDADNVDAATLQLPEVRSNIVLTTPESLGEISDANRQNVAGILLLDMLCHVHDARGMRNRAFVVQHDRPQLIANFRNDISHEGWLPPLILLTQKPAKSVSTTAVARAYCLNGWWFVDGRRLNTGCPPVSGQSNSSQIAGT